MHIRSSFKPFLLLLPASLTAAAPQSSLNDLPTCAQQAGLAAIDATGCGLTDLSCICHSVPFIDTLRTYITKNCSPSDQAAALTYGQTTCAPYGVTFTASVAGITATPTPAIVSDVVPMTTPAPLAGTVTSTLSPIATVSGTWMTGEWAPSMPTITRGSNATAALMPYTGGSAGAFSFGRDELVFLLAGMLGVAAFFV